jgi:hypothetical protein
MAWFADEKGQAADLRDRIGPYLGRGADWYADEDCLRWLDDYLESSGQHGLLGELATAATDPGRRAAWFEQVLSLLDQEATEPAEAPATEPAEAPESVDTEATWSDEWEMFFRTGESGEYEFAEPRDATRSGPTDEWMSSAEVQRRRSDEPDLAEVLATFADEAAAEAWAEVAERIPDLTAETDLATDQVTEALTETAAATAIEIRAIIAETTPAS